MSSRTRLAKERETVKDKLLTMDNQISMPALTSLLEEHHQSISVALSAELRDTRRPSATNPTSAVPGPPLPRQGQTYDCVPSIRHQTKELIVREACKRRNVLEYRGSPNRIHKDYCPDVLEQQAV
ncbi:hypothetical protein PAMP_019141 [Pampus punctatissimus]